ncbi:hypothetical protein FBEOM_13970 [Fusarium beomiforme]|uniref:Uncharacterized protein n=1 Tax=Fusarium beomiforme TaxID=44412 RepID=A0A9P5DRL1_9HYPO|nr:hypothetical protein FBEOM_13970 [Fusarium beomiforme]
MEKRLLSDTPNFKVLRVLANTVGKVNGGGYFHRNEKPKGDWILTKVAARDTHLWDTQDLGPTPEDADKQIEEEVRNEKPLPHFVGYSPFTLKPAFVVSYDQSEDQDDGERGPLTFSGCQLECGSGLQVANTEIIPHLSVLVGKSIVPITSLVIGKDWEYAFFNLQLNSDEAKDLYIRSCSSIHNRDSPSVLAGIQPPTTALVPNHLYPDSRKGLLPIWPKEVKDRLLDPVLPSAAGFLCNDEKPRGFIYKAPCMSNLVFPRELYKMLANFTSRYLFDKFNATAMLFATQLWVDIDRDDTKMREDFTSLEVPSISLSVFLIYFEHWLKIHEYFHCLKYAHPFRVIHQMYTADKSLNDDVFVINEDSINSDEVHSCLSKIKTRCEAISAKERAELYPFMINGTEMVHPRDVPQIPRLTPTQQALIGMPDLRVLGLPSYHQKQRVREIAMPTAIADLNFLHNRQELSNALFLGLRDTSSYDPTSQFGDSLKSGTIWAHEIQDFTLACGLPADAHIRQGKLVDWTRQLNRRMEWLRELGVMNRVRLQTGPDGLPGYHGMPLEDKAHLLQDEDMKDVVRRALENPVNRI